MAPTVRIKIDMGEQLIDLIIRPTEFLTPAIQRKRVATERANNGGIRAGPTRGADDSVSRDVYCVDPGDAGCREGGMQALREALDADFFVVWAAQVRWLDGVDGGGGIADEEAFGLFVR